MLSRSAVWLASSSPPSAIRSKKLVGGSCLLSPYHDRLPGADDGPQSFDRTDLARLVEHHQVEVDRSRWNVLGDRERAHHEDRLDALDRPACLLHEPTDGQVAGLLLELPLEDAQLAAAVVAWKLLPVPLGDQRPVVVELRHGPVRGTGR